MNILSHSYDIIILTETWLHEGVLDSEFIDTRYNVYRCDRNRAATYRRDGGGVLVAVLCSLSVTRCVPTPPAAPLDIPVIVDYILLEIRIDKSRFLICGVYIAPGTDSDIYSTFFNSLQEIIQVKGYDTFYLIGDFNLPHLDWHINGT